jgi:hypothetical protein
MDLVRLVYVSQVGSNFSDVDISQILEKAQTSNQELDVTGILLFTSEHFVQCLEGSRPAVNSLYNKIIQDPRHHDVQILLYNDAYSREFADWRMGYVGATQFNQDAWMQFLPSTDFNPAAMGGHNCLKMLLSLRSQIRTIGGEAIQTSQTQAC